MGHLHSESRISPFWVMSRLHSGSSLFRERADTATPPSTVFADHGTSPSRPMGCVHPASWVVPIRNFRRAPCGVTVPGDFCGLGRGAPRRDTEKAARPRRGRGRTPQTRGGTPRVRWTGADRHRPPQCFRTALPPRCSSRPGKDSTVKTRESQGSDFAQQGKSSFVC